MTEAEYIARFLATAPEGYRQILERAVAIEERPIWQPTAPESRAWTGREVESKAYALVGLRSAGIIRRVKVRGFYLYELADYAATKEALAMATKQ